MNLLSPTFEPSKSQLSIIKTANALGLDHKPYGNGRAILHCPFHDDKTPSCYIIENNPATGEGYYHCFGCEAGGDVFSLVQKIKGVSFPSAKNFVFSVNGFAVETVSPSNDIDTDTDSSSKFIELSPEQEISNSILEYGNSDLRILKMAMETLGFEKLIPKELLKPEELTALISKKIKKEAVIAWKHEAMAFFGANDRLLFFLDEPYICNNNKWEKLSVGEFRQLIINFLEYRFGLKWVTKSRSTEMFYFIEAFKRVIQKNNSFIFPIADDTDNQIFVYLKNRILSLSTSTGETSFLDPKKNPFFSTCQWNVSISLGDTDIITAPIFSAYLKRVQPKEENQILLMELMGYMLVPDNRLQKFFILQGEGKNGKSVFLSILKEMIGDGNYTSLSLDQLEHSYALSALIGKTANICADMGEIDKAAEGLLKSITSGDQITCDRKYLSAITFLPTAKHVFSTNNIPRFSDKTEGLWRRMIIIPFEEILDDNEIDVTITEKLKKENDQIFLFAVEGLKRIIRNGWRFSISENVKKTLNDERDNASTLRQFVKEKCELSSTDSIETHKFYHEYSSWTRANGQNPSSKNSIGRELNRLGVKSKVITYAGDSIRKYAGINLKE